MLALAAFAVGYNTTDSEVYLIPAMVVFAVWMGVGWGAVMVPSQRSVIQRGALVVMLAVPAFTLARNWSAQDLRADHTARDFVDGVMAQAPARAIVVTREDRHTFALWVGTLVERQRPDLAVVDQDLLGYDWYRARLRRSFPDLSVPEVSGDVGELARSNPGRPVCRPAEMPPAWISCEDE